jgi:hypothetical protein
MDACPHQARRGGSLIAHHPGFQLLARPLASKPLPRNPTPSHHPNYPSSLRPAARDSRHPCIVPLKRQLRCSGNAWQDAHSLAHKSNNPPTSRAISVHLVPKVGPPLENTLPPNPSNFVHLVHKVECPQKNIPTTHSPQVVHLVHKSRANTSRLLDARVAPCAFSAQSPKTDCLPPVHNLQNLPPPTKRVARPLRLICKICRIPLRGPSAKRHIFIGVGRWALDVGRWALDVFLLLAVPVPLPSRYSL